MVSKTSVGSVGGKGKDTKRNMGGVGVVEHKENIRMVYDFHFFSLKNILCKTL